MQSSNCGCVLYCLPIVSDIESIRDLKYATKNDTVSRRTAGPTAPFLSVLYVSACCLNVRYIFIGVFKTSQKPA